MSNEIYRNIVVECGYVPGKSKVKVYPVSGQGVPHAFVQFPSKIRECGKRFICDLTDTGRGFYRAVTGSIKESNIIQVERISRVTNCKGF